MNKTALVFPGQGSQFIGMGKEFYEQFPEARLVFEEVDACLGESLSRLIFEGDLETLTLTHHTQPALMAVSMAMVRVLEKEGGTPLRAQIMAGHSLGEYTAYCASGALSIETTTSLLRHRGLFMQQAVPVGEGAMAAILGLGLEEVEKALQGLSVSPHSPESLSSFLCVVANDNAPGQVVISGHSKAVQKGIELSLERGAKRGILLPVSAPFHSPLMRKATLEMTPLLQAAPFSSPRCPVLSNVTAAPVETTEAAISLLIRQIEGRVRWRESMTFLESMGITHVIEIGAGSVLTGLLKRCAPSLAGLSFQSVSQVDMVLSCLRGENSPE